VSGFNWGLSPSGKEPSGKEPAGKEPAKSDDSEAPQPETQQPADAQLPVADEDDPFSIFTPKPVAKPAAEPDRRAASTPTSTPTTDELGSTQAMPTSYKPYRPPAGPVEPPAEPFAFTPLPNASLPVQAPAATPIDPPAAATTALPANERPATSAGIDDVFGDAAFREYEDAPLIAPLPLRRDPDAPREPRAPLTQNQRMLIGVAAGLVAALVLLLFFVLGTNLPGLAPGAAPQPTASATPRVTKTATAPVTGPQPAGVHSWSTLNGGECIDPFDTAWAAEFTVVGCATPHAAQLVAKGVFDETTYPGADKLATEAKAACVSSKVIDYAAASAYTDLTLATSYASSQQDWDAGNTSYYCFVNRPGDTIVGTLAKTP
jgi:Septum formation